MTSEAKPNPADFSVDERPREYRISLRIKGSMDMTVEAGSLEDAQRQAEDWADRVANGEDDADLDDVYDVSVDHVAKTLPLYRVIRNGSVSQVSHLRPGDLPREPDERGF